MGPGDLGDGHKSEEKEGLAGFSENPCIFLFGAMRVTGQDPKEKKKKISQSFGSMRWHIPEHILILRPRPKHMVHKPVVHADGGDGMIEHPAGALAEAGTEPAQLSVQASCHFAVNIPSHDSSKKFYALVTLDTARILDDRDSVSTFRKTKA